MNLSGAAIVATAVMVHLVAPVAEADLVVDLVVLVEGVVVPAADPVPRRVLKVRVVARNVGIVLPDPAVMVAIPADAMVVPAFAPKASARPHPRRCLKSNSQSRPRI